VFGCVSFGVSTGWRAKCSSWNVRPMMRYPEQTVRRAPAAVPASGRSFPTGATLALGGANFSIFSRSAVAICEWDAEQPVPGTTYRAGARSVVVLIAGNGRKPDIATEVHR